LLQNGKKMKALTWAVKITVLSLELSKIGNERVAEL
jgi:hypothetical protein